MRRTRVREVALGACAAGAIALSASGCASLTSQGENVVRGKQLFVAKCGACHVLERAGTKGVTGPNLDMAFVRAREDGFGESSFKGIVHRQIQQPNRSAQVDPATGKTLPLMPAKLVEGEDAADVAAYVASAVGKPGKDTGALAQVGAAQAKGTAKEKNGELDIPADPSGALAYKFANAAAQPGAVTIKSQNDSSINHDISIEGNGVDEHGQVVKDGGVSEVKATLKPGDYTFYCSVPGHREGGMEGKLTVK
jgi:plastocyanin